MDTPSFSEDHISQIPALLMLIKLGYNYISHEQVMHERGYKTSNVLLENILFDKLKELNNISFKGNEYEFSEANVLSAIQALKNLSIQEGYINANQELYNLITLGKSFEQTIGGDKKSFQFKYIDWEKPENNIFHVAEEFSVKRTGSNKEYRPDIVLFVNGIPFVVIENKSPSLSGTTKPVDLATEQHLRNQEIDGIRDLYKYSQLIISLAVNENRYGTTGTDKEFFGEWKERFLSKEEENKYKNNIQNIKNNTILEPRHGVAKYENTTQINSLFAERYHYAKKYFHQLETEEQSITPQDEILYNLCRPERLLELVYNFIVYDNGVKKIARYQQYFAVKKTILRVRPLIAGKRNGGVIWHTQGSGKSLTMVMLAQLLAMDSYIRNPQIVIVTDRIDLDDQILGTFQKCGKKVKQADKGASLLIRKYLKGKKLTDNENKQLQNDTSLLKLLLLDKDIIITTVINKFEAAVKELKNNSSFIEKNTILNSPDIFVLVDEGHRSQYGSFNVQMQKALPNACFIAFTGTPLMKKEKNTATRFGGEIDRYTITQAVEDKAVVPLLFEGRLVLQEVNSKALDTFFDNVSEPLSQYQRGELKRKFNRADQLNKADQKIYTIAWDIAKYWDLNWKNTGFKAQLVTPDKNTAIKYKEYLDETGLVTSEVVFSPPDTREGTETAYSKPTDRVLKFWNAMIDKHGNSKKYADNIINAFKNREQPEIIIVVDKLLTGFDAPQNRVLFITRNLREHTLLQAIARVNRVYPGKDNGIIIDYYGILGELDEALSTYSGLQDFDPEDLVGIITNIKEEIKKLSQYHSDLREIFKEIKNKYDENAYEELLSDEYVRHQFYDKLSLFSRTLKLALSTLDFEKSTPEDTVQKYKEDAKFFLKLRVSVKHRYSDDVDYKQYEPQVQKLIDRHITSDEVIKITDLVNIFEQEKFQEEVDKIKGKAAKADTIASRTAKHINENMDTDPVFFKKLSELLKQTIEDYKNKRITEAEYLKRVQNIKEQALSEKRSNLPEIIVDKPIAQAYFGVLNQEIIEETSNAEIALTIDDIFSNYVLDNGNPVIDWQKNGNLLGKLKIAIEDYLFEAKDKYNLEIGFDEIDVIIEKCIGIAKKRYI